MRYFTWKRELVSDILWIVVDITVEYQGNRFLSIQDAKQAVEQFELRTHSRFSVYKYDKGFGEKG